MLPKRISDKRTEFLSWNVISESDGGEGDEDEVDGVDEVPLRLGEREGDRGDDDEGDDEDPRHGQQVDQPLEFGYDWGQIVDSGVLGQLLTDPTLIVGRS